LFCLVLTCADLVDNLAHDTARSFPTESRAKILPLCRRDYPLPPPINRGSVDDLREKKIECKLGRKPAFPAQFSCNQLFLFFFSSSWPSATTTIITCLLTIVPTLSSHQNHHTWWLHHFSLSSVKILFSATVTPAAAAPTSAAATTLPRSFYPSQRKLGQQPSPQLLQQFQPRASLLLCRTLFLLLPTVTRASRRPHNLQLHCAPPVRPPAPSTPGKLPSSLLLPPPFPVIAACEQCNVNYFTLHYCVQLSHWVVPVTKLLWAGPVLAQPSWLGRVQPIPKIKRRRILWAEFDLTFLGRYWPLLFGLSSA